MQTLTSLKDLFYSMLRIRRIEEEIANRYSNQEMRCPMHLCIGQEAIAAGISVNLNPNDKVFSNHRAHGHYLAKGGDLKALIAELYGRQSGCCGGRGGSMHLVDIRVNFIASTPIVGGTVPVAVGSAWASSLKKENTVTAVYFGDGCFEEGVMHESMNFAALHNLPIVFICENNNFSVYTKLEYRQPKRPIYKIAEAHGITSFYSDGNDIEEVVDVSGKAINNARNRNGPQFLEFLTYRWREHCGPNFDNDLNYRSPQEIENGHKKCPIEFLKQKIQYKDKHFNLEIKNYEYEINREIQEAFNFALSSPFPKLAFEFSDLYA
jgi:pyruvate dehydrogenase E1 component alpha subunit